MMKVEISTTSTAHAPGQTRIVALAAGAFVTAGADGELVYHKFTRDSALISPSGHRRVHKGAVNNLCISSDERTVLSVGDDSSLFRSTIQEDGTIQQQLLYKASLPLRLVNYRAMSSEGGRIFCFGNEMKLIVLDDTGRVLHSSNTLRKKVMGLLAINDGVVTLEEDGRVCRYDIATEELRETHSVELRITCRKDVGIYYVGMRIFICDPLQGLFVLSASDLSFVDHIMPPGTTNFVMAIGKANNGIDSIIMCHSKGICIINPDSAELEETADFDISEPIIAIAAIDDSTIGFVSDEGNIGILSVNHTTSMRIKSSNGTLKAALPLMYSDEDDDESDNPRQSASRTASPMNTKKTSHTKETVRKELEKKYLSSAILDESEVESHNSYDVPSDYNVEEGLENHQHNIGHPTLALPKSIHNPFQPGRTPLVDGYRYLAWNDIGVIISRQDQGYCSVEVDFSDRNFHHPIRFIDEVGFTMAAIGQSGVVFASHRSTLGDATVISSKILLHPYSTWTKNPSFQLDFNNTDEDILGVAIGKEKYCVIATSHGLIRTISINGLQGPIFTFSGQFYSMVAHADNLFLLTFDPLSNRVFYALYKCGDEVSLVKEGELGYRFTAKTISWIGFSPSGQPALFDDSQTLYICDIKAGYLWRPWLDLSLSLEHKGHTFWPTCITSSDASGVVLESGMYPEVIPRPLLTIIPLKIPFVNVNSDPIVASFEKSVRTGHFLGRQKDASIEITDRECKKSMLEADKHILELIQLAIKAERQPRVLELCQFFLVEKSWDLAIQLVKHNKLSTLANMLEELRDSKKNISSSFTEFQESHDDWRSHRRLGQRLSRPSVTESSEKSISMASAEEDNHRKGGELPAAPKQSPSPMQVETIPTLSASFMRTNDSHGSALKEQSAAVSRNLNDIMRTINLEGSNTAKDNYSEGKRQRSIESHPNDVANNHQQIKKVAQKQLCLTKFSKVSVQADENSTSPNINANSTNCD